MNKYLITLLAVFALTACDSRVSTSDLTSQVKSELEAGYEGLDIKIESLILTRESSESNKYTGIMKTTEPAGSITYTVKVTYDGENITYMVEQF